MRWLTRLRAAVPAHRVNYFVHAGNSLAVVASLSDDMVQLRSFMIGATTCGMFYNLLQPTPLWTPCYWGAFFITAHTVQIGRILRERSDVTMSEREHELYERCFMAHGFTPRMFLALMKDAGASWVSFAPGEKLCTQGDEAAALHLVSGGTGSIVVMQRSDSAATEPEEDEPRGAAQRVTGEVGRGQKQSLPLLQRKGSSNDGVLSRMGQETLRSGVWIGDCWRDAAATRTPPNTDPPMATNSNSAGRRWNATATAVDGTVEAVRFDAAKFHAVTRSLGKNAVEASERMQIAALKSERMHGRSWQAFIAARNKEKMRQLEREHLQQRNTATYEAMVALAVADGVVAPEERVACASFRATHGINDEQHREALARAGWSDERAFMVKLSDQQDPPHT